MWTAIALLQAGAPQQQAPAAGSEELWCWSIIGALALAVLGLARVYWTERQENRKLADRMLKDKEDQLEWLKSMREDL